MEEFVDRQSEDRQVNLGNALKGPVIGVLHDRLVDVLDLLDDTMNELFCKGVVCAFRLLIFDKNAQGVIQLVRLIQFPLVEELDGAGTAIASLRASVWLYGFVVHCFLNWAISSAAMANS